MAQTFVYCRAASIFPCKLAMNDYTGLTSNIYSTNKEASFRGKKRGINLTGGPALAPLWYLWKIMMVPADQYNVLPECFVFRMK